MKIALMTEGTYPFAFGGVSVWCDQLIRGMPGYDFHLVAARQRRLDGHDAAVGPGAGPGAAPGPRPAGPPPVAAAAPAHRDPARLPCGCTAAIRQRAARTARVLRPARDVDPQPGQRQGGAAADRGVAGPVHRRQAAGAEPADELDIAGAATFEGRVDDIRDAYQAGSIVVLCSVSEGFPYSLIEAMTCGRACVATDVGGVTEALGDTGLIVSPRSPERLARACLTLLRDGRMRHRLGSAARTRALEYFTVDEAINTFDEIYHFLGSGQPLPTAPASPAPAPGAPR